MNSETTCHGACCAATCVDQMMGLVPRDYVTLADFFIVGLGLDVAGATLLTRG